MKKLILLALITLASCAAPKKISQPTYETPKSFDEAEKWFDDWHKR